MAGAIASGFTRQSYRADGSIWRGGLRGDEYSESVGSVFSSTFPFFTDVEPFSEAVGVALNPILDLATD
jgi:hypothetical protein